jgi:hypothetical protein
MRPSAPVDRWPGKPGWARTAADSRERLIAFTTVVVVILHVARVERSEAEARIQT